MPEGLSWLRNHSEAYCVTFAQGLDDREAMRRFGGDLSQARLIQPDDWQVIAALRALGEVIQVGRYNGWAFVYEDNGFRGTLQEVLCAVSARTVAVSVFCNVNAVARFCYAEDGTIIAHFDPLDPPFADPAPQLQTLLRQARITQKEDAQDNGETYSYDFVAAMFALAEAAGVSLDQAALLERPLLTSYVRNPLSDFVDDVLARGGDEHTVDRLFALLADRWGHAPRLLHILKQGQRMGILPQRKDRRPLLTERMRIISDGVLQALISSQAIPALLDALAGSASHLRQAAKDVLHALICFDRAHDQDAARARLLALTESAETEVAWPAALALGDLGDQRAVGPLLRILEQVPSLSALWQQAGMVYSPAGKAAQLLGQLRATSAIEPLLNLLDPLGRDADFQRALYSALAHIGGEQIIERLWPLLEPLPRSRGERTVQQALLATLAQLKNPGSVERLLTLLNPEPEPVGASDFQLHVLKALGNMGDRRAIEPLAQLLNPDAQGSAAWFFQHCLVATLRQLGDTRAELQVVEQTVQTRHQAMHGQATRTFRAVEGNLREGQQGPQGEPG